MHCQPNVSFQSTTLISVQYTEATFKTTNLDLLSTKLITVVTEPSPNAFNPNRIQYAVRVFFFAVIGIRRLFQSNYLNHFMTLFQSYLLYVQVLSHLWLVGFISSCGSKNRATAHMRGKTLIIL